MAGYGPGDLDLAALAQQATGETQQRVNGGASHLAASLASMLQEQQGGFAARGEAQGRDEIFARAQAMLAESLAQREQNMQLAEQSARAQASGSGGSGGGSGQPNWYEQQMFATNENIRQAKALRAMDLQDKAAADKQAAAASRFKLADFGERTISPLRGQAFDYDPVSVVVAGKGRAGSTKVSKVKPPTITPAERTATLDLMRQYGASPQALDVGLRDYFGDNLYGTQKASRALYEIGYGVGQ